MPLRSRNAIASPTGGRPLNQRIPLLALGLASPALLLLLVTGRGAFGAWFFAFGVMLFPAALIALAAGRRARRVAVAIAAKLVAGAALMLGLAGGGRIGGLPGSTWAMFALLWAWPLIVTVWAYAASFREREGGSPEAGNE